MFFVRCGKEYAAVPDLTNCECGGILEITYDYAYIKTQLTKEKLEELQREEEKKRNEVVEAKKETASLEKLRERLKDVF